MKPDFSVKFWGVRGTVPCPGADTLRYGGNTSCVEVRCGETRLIFDAGSGLRALGREVLSAGRPIDAHLFLTHTHLDHIIGLPFFKPAYAPCNRVELWNGHLRRQGMTLAQVLGRLMEAPFFPVPLDIMHACIAFHDFDAGERFALGGGIDLRTAPLNHPGGATGYRVDYDGRSFCYITDTEHREGALDPVILDLVAGADLMVYDAMYTEAEYEQHRGWGHSTWQEGVRLCEAADVARMAAFHHDPLHDDAVMATIDAALAARRAGSFAAREGVTIAL